MCCKQVHSKILVFKKHVPPSHHTVGFLNHITCSFLLLRWAILTNSNMSSATSCPHTSRSGACDPGLTSDTDFLMLRLSSHNILEEGDSHRRWSLMGRLALMPHSSWHSTDCSTRWGHTGPVRKSNPRLSNLNYVWQNQADSQRACCQQFGSILAEV